MSEPADKLQDVIREAIGDAPDDPRDAAVVALALTYARKIDDGDGDLLKLGPQLLAVLESLQMSPRSRAAARRGMRGDDEPGADDGKPRSVLDELRDRRARKHPSAPGDAPAS